MLSYLDFNLPCLAISCEGLNNEFVDSAVFPFFPFRTRSLYFTLTFVPLYNELMHKSNSKPLLNAYFVNIVDRIRSSIS